MSPPRLMPSRTIVSPLSLRLLNGRPAAAFPGVQPRLIHDG
jgi:hypothetical protein